MHAGAADKREFFLPCCMNAEESARCRDVFLSSCGRLDARDWMQDAKRRKRESQEDVGDWMR